MASPFSLQGKNIVITGASSGIGRSASLECAKAGANLFLIARNQERLEETFRNLPTLNHQYLSLDLLNYGQYEIAVSDFVSRNGKIDGFIHAAGVLTTLPLSLIKPEHFEQVFAINVTAGFELAKVIAKKKFIDPEKGASFVFLSSIRALHGLEGSVIYSASKGAVSAAVRSMALELAPRKIRVNAVLPSIVRTEMIDSFFSTIPEESVQKMAEAHPLGFGMPEDVANACIYLLTDASRWMTGTNLVLDGGYSAK
jgi:NAD(P)-dependent dehydrogenase (short-subunit alcohol dehydrogenase family)